jgi:hypothetical protein
MVMNPKKLLTTALHAHHWADPRRLLRRFLGINNSKFKKYKRIGYGVQPQVL